MYDQTKLSGYMDSYNETLLDMIWKHKIKLIFFISITIIGYINIPYLEKVQQTMKYKEKFPKTYLNASEIKKRKNQFDIVIDTRTKEEYDKSHVNGGIHIDYKDILSQNGKKILKENGINKTKNILFYCDGGNRAQRSALHLVDVLGYKSTNVFLTNEPHTNIDVIIPGSNSVE
uniref:Rhodanese domain-containing protein n=1 Tax=viral metagenome TaxID=1070528 RepID=A0A6C0KK03_9ZZZZ